MNFLKINWEDLGALLLDKLITIILVSLLFFILYQAGTRIVKRLFKNYSEQKWTDTSRILTLSRLTTSGIHYLTVFLYIYTVLGLIGIPVGNVLAGAGIIGVALGFAGRDLVADIINGFFIIVEHQINVGDTVAFSGLDIEGIVKTVGIRSITVIGADGATTFIPNRNIAALKNYSYTARTVNLDVPVDLSVLTETKAHILSVNADYPQVKFAGIINHEEKLFIRSTLTASSAELPALKMEILDKYYDNSY
ncbi:mechanosensitive ion channel family protein [Lactococcus allomyrinae]|uniref:Potassium transporter KefA n=1 Tax=Lactococcus allomyrinae TaxID=2419773 RepID=A0A387BH89_9LACT|nr:mechanosensitive ion channel domain-containing protein [Lactococcus allomyrinae]AYG00387.1 potassium transporter KefA [Lactococcus allomyrinae]